MINWVKQAGDSLPDATPAEVIPELAQLDELQTFVGSKKQAMAVDSRRRQASRHSGLATRRSQFGDVLAVVVVGSRLAVFSLHHGWIASLRLLH